jgi:restriction system protein
MEGRSNTPHDLVFLPTSELPVLERIRRLSWQAFEDFMAEAYRRRGYHVEQMRRGRADGGYDLVLLRENVSVLVQCKHWLTYTVGVPRVRELAGAMQKVGATGGVFVTTGDFTQPARLFATGMPIELVDGEGLIRLLTATAEQPQGQVAAVPGGETPTCPKCQKPMAWRTTERGGRPLAKPFWGCADFPRCWGKRQAA